jgi:hypothetical protein
MFGSGGIQLFRRVAGLRECPDRSDRRLPLRSEHFPVEAKAATSSHGRASLSRLQPIPR